MIDFRSLVLLTAFVAFLRITAAIQLPYNPTSLIVGPNNTVYAITPNSQPQFSVYDASKQILGTDGGSTLAGTLPFLTDTSKGFATSFDQYGISAVVGDCAQNKQDLEVWRYAWQETSPTWSQYKTSISDTSLSADFLAAAFTFSSTNSSQNAVTYTFGGMCPSSAGNSSAWTGDATYSNTIVAAALTQQSDTQISITGQRAPPIPEAGLTITPLQSSLSTIGSSTPALQQNFVLLGGHTQTAFINMSQVALFSLPEQAWAFLDIDHYSAVTIEPRSGHTALLTEDGSKIVVLGGWVGDVSTPATPQLVILNVGQGYGGNSSWSWSIPQQVGSPYSNTQGIFGHGAVMLPGDVMMISGGFPITATNNPSKRSGNNNQFFNVNTATWTTSWTPSTTDSVTVGKSAGKGTKAGIGAGIGIAVAVILVIIVAWWLYAKRKKQQRVKKEKELRAMALGTGKSYSNAQLALHGAVNGMRTASWGSRQEKMIETGSYMTKIQGIQPPQVAMSGNRNSMFQDEKTGGIMNIPSPSSSQRHSLVTRGNSRLGRGPPVAGGVFTIEEAEDERSDSGSVKRRKLAETPRPTSDPFKDSHEIPAHDEAALERRREVKGWVEDWASAAEVLNVSRSPSKATGRTYSSLSAYHSSNSGRSNGRISPDKSDRTGSNLSERSLQSDYSQRSLAHTASLRSASAGYTLFAGAASAMSRLTGIAALGNPVQTDLNRSASKRSISTGDLAQLAARKQANSIEKRPMHAQPLPLNTSSEPHYDQYRTPPESPIKDYKRSRERSSSLTNQSKKAFNVLSNATKRVLTGTAYVDVPGRVDAIENTNISPTKPPPPERFPTTDQLTTGRSTSTPFWLSRQGQQGWQDTEPPVGMRQRSINRDPEIPDDPDWDVEAAVQQRVVQVMFTVPKERLRVVNADDISLLSRSETTASREEVEMSPPPSPPPRNKQLWSQSAWADREESIKSKRSQITIGKAM